MTLTRRAGGLRFRSCDSGFERSCYLTFEIISQKAAHGRHQLLDLSPISPPGQLLPDDTDVRRRWGRASGVRADRSGAAGGAGEGCPSGDTRLCWSQPLCNKTKVCVAGMAPEGTRLGRGRGQGREPSAVGPWLDPPSGAAGRRVLRDRSSVCTPSGGVVLVCSFRKSL